LIPGKTFNIPLHLIDDFNRSEESIESLLVAFEGDSMRADRDYILRGNLRFFGMPYSKDTLKVM